MKTKKLLILAISMTVMLFAGSSLAQFTIKIPKVPKIDKQTDQVTNNNSTNNNNGNSNNGGSNKGSNGGGRSGSSGKHVYTNAKPTGSPVLVRDTLYIQALTAEEYWKMPNQRNYSSWRPDIKVHIFYNNSNNLNLVAEYTNPDGTAWYSEKLDQGPMSEDDTVGFESPRPNNGEVEMKRSTVNTGLYGLKITNKDSGEVMFQGKFKVSKYRAFDDPRDKNRFEFYVEHDWLIPVGYVGFQTGGSLEIGTLSPSVAVWLKGPVKREELEARLFRNGAQIATTANNGGNAVDEGERSTFSSARFPDQYLWKQWHFNWKTFLFDNGNAYNPDNYPGAIYADKNPGEYTVKIYRNGNQIREMKFTIGADGRFADAGFGKGMNLLNYNVVVPVKVIGTGEKWNATSWKTDAFYGNPMSGFDVQ